VKTRLTSVGSPSVISLHVGSGKHMKSVGPPLIPGPQDHREGWCLRFRDPQSFIFYDNYKISGHFLCLDFYLGPRLIIIIKKIDCGCQEFTIFFCYQIFYELGP